MADNFPKLLLKAHVKHAIRLIQNQVSDPPHICDVCVHEIDKTAWSGNQDLNTALKLLLLFSPRYSTIACTCLDLAAYGKLIALCFNLTA